MLIIDLSLVVVIFMIFGCAHTSCHARFVSPPYSSIPFSMGCIVGVNGSDEKIRAP